MQFEPAARPSHRNLAALLALTVAALVLRLTHLGYLLPHHIEGDTAIVRQGMLLDDWLHGDEHALEKLEPDYPLLLGSSLAILPGRLAPLAAGDALEPHLAAASRPYILGRGLVACLGILLIPGAYLLARRVLEPGWSLFAAALVATSLLHTSFSQQARPHVPLASLSLLAILASMRLARRPSLFAYLQAGLCAALAIACLQNGLAVLPALLAGHLVALRERARGEGAGTSRAGSAFVRRLFSAPALLSLALVLGGLLASWPGLLRPGTRSGISVGGEELRITGSHRVPWEYFNGKGFVRMPRLLWNYDPTLVVLVCLGVLAVVYGLMRRRSGRPVSLCAADAPIDRRERIVAAAFACPYVLALGSYENIFSRFLLPLLPFLAVLAACGVRAVCTWGGWPLAQGRWRGSFSLVLCGALLALPACVCVRLVWLRGRPDTLTLTARWVSAHVDREADTIASEIYFRLPLLRSSDTLAAMPLHQNFPWDRYEPRLAPGQTAANAWRFRPILERPPPAKDPPQAWAVARRLQTIGARYAIVMLTRGAYSQLDPTAELVHQLAGEPLVQFSAGDVGGDPLLYTLENEGIGRVLRMKSLGPVMQIYRVQ